MTQTKYLEGISDLISEREAIFRKDISITNRNTIPSDGKYPLENNQWFKIPDVICLFVDIRNSTGLSAVSHDKSTASIYELFTGTAIKILHSLEAEYIDIKGDGVFALFSKNKVHRALVSAISFKTFAYEKFLSLIKRKLNGEVDVGFHMGIDQKTVLVKTLGLRNTEGRDIRKNEVWAGKPINMASKLAALSKDGELLISDRFYSNLSKDDLVQKTCGCVVGGEQRDAIVDIWEEKEISEDSNFDFDSYYISNKNWCKTHGKEWAEKILKLD